MKHMFAVGIALLISSNAFAIDPFCAPWKNNAEPAQEYCTADHPNAIFVLELAANFCGPCNNNAPNIERLAADYADEPRVQVLDVMTDQSDSEISKWIRNHNPNHPVLKDVGRKVWNQTGAQYIPTMVITDCKGEVKYQFTGSLNRSAVNQVLDRLLAEDCDASK